MKTRCKRRSDWHDSDILVTDSLIRSRLVSREGSADFCLYCISTLPSATTSKNIFSKNLNFVGESTAKCCRANATITTNWATMRSWAVPYAGILEFLTSVFVRAHAMFRRWTNWTVIECSNFASTPYRCTVIYTFGSYNRAVPLIIQGLQFEEHAPHSYLTFVETAPSKDCSSRLFIHSIYWRR